MKKTTMIGLVAILVAGAASAQDGVVMVGQPSATVDNSQAKVSAEAAVMSSYVWRGQVYNNDMVLQPQVTVAQYGVSANIWGNYDIGRNTSGVQSDFSELDLSLAYTLPIDINEVTFDVGLINYHFPANGNYPPAKPSPSTTELYASATFHAVPYVVPSVTAFGDIQQVDGAYFLFDLMVPYEVSDYLTVRGGVSAGYGSTTYNDYYWGPGKDANWNDYNIYGQASYEIMPNLTASLNLTYTFLDGTVRDAAKANYETDEKVWGGVGVAYDF